MLATSLFKEHVNNHRLAGFDAMRAFCVILGVILHASLGYLVHYVSEWPHLKQHNLTFDCLAWVIHMFRVPVFYFIAGFFAYQLWTRYSYTQFIRNRCNRIVIPFFISVVIFNLPLILLFAFSDKPKTIANLFSVFCNLGYNWFLEYLIIFYALFFLIVPILKSEACNKLIRKVLAKKWFLYIAWLATFIILYSTNNTYIPTDLSAMPNPSLLMLYSLFFFIGACCARNLDLFEIIFKWRIFYFILACCLVLGNMLIMYHNKSNLEHVAIFLYSGASCLLLYTFVSGCIRFCSKPNEILRYIAEASYWIYLTQVYIILRLQQAFSAYDNMFVQFTATVLITLIVGLVSFDLLFRKRGLMRLAKLYRF